MKHEQFQGRAHQPRIMREFELVMAQMCVPDFPTRKKEQEKKGESRFSCLVMTLGLYSLFSFTSVRLRQLWFPTDNST